MLLEQHEQFYLCDENKKKFCNERLKALLTTLVNLISGSSSDALNSKQTKVARASALLHTRKRTGRVNMDTALPNVGLNVGRVLQAE